MNMINVTLVGNLVKAPERHSFQSGRTKTTLRIAVTNPSRNKDEGAPQNSDFYRVELWGKLGDLASNYLLKGHQVGVSGRLIMERWVDKEGRERLTPVVAATQLQLPPRATFSASSTSQMRPQPAKNIVEEENFDPASESPEDTYRASPIEEVFGDARPVAVHESASNYTPFRAPKLKRA